jgi:glycolate oxidase iron-sulfur subunit
VQTQLAPAYQDTPDGRRADAVLRSCVHCGFCNATCPTYKLTGDELDGPRGRIYLMKQVFEGQAPTRTTQRHLDRCIGCRHCETTCPSGVQYNELLSVGQAEVERQVRRPLMERLRRWGLRTVLPSRAFGPLLKAGRWLRPVLPAALAGHVPVAPALAPPAWPAKARQALHARRMLMPQGCVQPHLRPHIDAATARVLDAVGVRAVMVRGAGCCGALKGHLGDEDGARVQARRNIDAWWPYIEAEVPVEAILVNASGCGAWVKDYDQLLADDPAYADKAQRVASLLKDPAELLPQWLPALRRRLRVRTGGLGQITFHPPCSYSHALKLGNASRPGPVETCLRELGFDLRLAACDAHQCCGAGGAYSLLQPELAEPLRQAKVAALNATGSPVVASANIGCITHLQSGMSVPVKHWIELVDEALGRPVS